LVSQSLDVKNEDIDLKIEHGIFSAGSKWQDNSASIITPSSPMKKSSALHSSHETHRTTVYKHILLNGGHVPLEIELPE
jgi:hypothetical protein